MPAAEDPGVGLRAGSSLRREAELYNSVLVSTVTRVTPHCHAKHKGTKPRLPQLPDLMVCNMVTMVTPRPAAKRSSFRNLALVALIGGEEISFQSHRHLNTRVL